MSNLGDLFKPRMLTLAALDEIDKRVRPTICTHTIDGSRKRLDGQAEGRISEDDYDTLMAVARQFARMP